MRRGFMLLQSLIVESTSINEKEWGVNKMNLTLGSAFYNETVKAQFQKDLTILRLCSIL